MKRVLIVMGSENDLEVMLPARSVLDDLGIAVELTVASAHRSPERVLEIARTARERGIGVLIAAAGGAAHLAGVLAANCTLPVVAVPVAMGTLGGVDALLSSVQMPGGVPIAAVGINGARNAALFAAAILAANDDGLAERLRVAREQQAAKVVDSDRRVQKTLAALK